ncbi:MAG: DUF742 domain-containing protein [Acidimicrobiia bacterium]
MTRGRTGADQPRFALEALVSATAMGLRMRSHFQWEAAEIIATARKQTAIIELAALLDVPIGVVRVLTADLFEKGAVTVTDPPSQTVAERDSRAYTDLLQKVLDGIKAL